jgi:16S rRNA (cytidine1402-2'-O)-methyltransferase
LNTDHPLVLEAAAIAAGGQQYPPGALYVVATPIGNLADIGLRAVHVLARSECIACEDTRTSTLLLRALGLHKPLLALHEHNEREAAEQVVRRLRAGHSVAYVCDAGTPAVSDPGAALVAAVRAAGQAVVPIPGPSSALAALSVAGDTGAVTFRFVGFLPAKGRARDEAIAQAAADPSTQIVFEAPHRVEQLCRSLAGLAPARRVTVARELTKQYETVATLPAAELPEWLQRDPKRRRGEFVVVLHALPREAAAPAVGERAERILRLLLSELPLKRAVALAAEISGAPRNALYEFALALRGDAN